ncbi:MAG: extracellular solute-binding protein, partial [Chloroflexi bacterium]|nr:extracellular solute-binding protein [Chloroflexota bacterium]
MVHRRSFAWLLLVALLVPILAACGGGTTEPTASGAASPAASASAAASPAASASAAASPSESAAASASPEASASGEASPSASAGAEASASPSGAASGEIVVPDVAGLRTDLQGQTIQWVAGADGPGTAYDEAAAAKFEEITGADVEIIRGDQSATDRLSTYLQQLNAGAGPDVLQIDVIWPGILADYAADLKPAITDLDKFFPAIVENNTVNGKLVGVPWYTDAGLLYYREDLLEKYGFDGPPETWTELEQQAKTIQDGERAAGKPDFYGYVWQGNSYEGLTCNALEWQVSNGGGQIVEGSPDAPQITINNEQAIAAFERAKGWVGTISPQGVTTYDEPTSLGVWQAGNAAFMRNWPYAVAETQNTDFADSFNVTVLPKGDGANARNADTLGGW